MEAIGSPQSFVDPDDQSDLRMPIPYKFFPFFEIASNIMNSWFAITYRCLQ